MSFFKPPRAATDAGAWVHDALVILCVAGVLFAVYLLFFGGLGSTAPGGGVGP